MYKRQVRTESTGLAVSMTAGSVAGLVQDISVTAVPTTISVGSSLRVGSGNTSDTELLRVIDFFPSRRIVRVERTTGIAHTVGSNIDVLNNKITIPVKTTKFNSEVNDIVYFNGAQSVGVGTTPGGAIEVNEFIGGLDNQVSIPTRTIRIPNHPFFNGQ